MRIKHLVIAANNGKAPAQYLAALCYEEGAGVRRDMKQAITYYRQTAAQNHSDAKKALKRLGINY